VRIEPVIGGIATSNTILCGQQLVSSLVSRVTVDIRQPPMTIHGVDEMMADAIDADEQGNWMSEETKMSKDATKLACHMIE
jgi:hypothetical protein